MQSKRYEQVKQTLIKRGFGSFLQENINEETYKESPQKRLRYALEDLGGGFVLLGQMLRFRVDLIPAAYCKALTKLRDKGTPISFQEFKTTLAKQYSRPLETIFANINKRAIFVDVITQTHEATLVNGNKVQVKIIKPYAKKIVKEDSTILQFIAKKISFSVATTRILSELKTYVQNKFDLEIEETFLSHSGKYASQYIPQVMNSISNKNVLVVKYIKKKPVEHLKKQMNVLEKNVRFIQGEVFLSVIGVLLVIMGIFLPKAIATIFIYLSILCFALVFILLWQHPK